ncbi:MAG: twin-arginine translocase TatA/TatE family subunit [Archangium sp.]
MFNIGSGEIALIAVVALLILGPKRLPELARGIGKFMREFRRQTDEVRGVVEREFYKMDQDVSLPGNVEDPLPRPAQGGVANGADPHGHDALGHDALGHDAMLNQSQLAAGLNQADSVPVPLNPPAPAPSAETSSAPGAVSGDASAPAAPPPAAEPVAATTPSSDAPLKS